MPPDDIAHMELSGSGHKDSLMVYLEPSGHRLIIKSQDLVEEEELFHKVDSNTFVQELDYIYFGEEPLITLEDVVPKWILGQGTHPVVCFKGCSDPGMG